MGKTRVHLLAKELGIETKDLIAQLDKLGIRGRKAQSSLEDDEVTRLRAALAVQEKPQIHIGEEKVVADRVVTAESENLGEIQARETGVEQSSSQRHSSPHQPGRSRSAGRRESRGGSRG